jgi:guanosine-3',5'-bis(diphosphate) 3'-pyrophosphohydrolase
VLLRALHFAAEKHRDQRRKGAEAPPYINHPIEVAELLARVGEVTDLVTLQAAILHDTVEDTDTTPAELTEAFGAEVESVVAEVTDDKSLPWDDRKRRQVEHAASLSARAKLVKIADKISNVRGIIHDPPTHWETRRILGYLDWTERVVNGCRGANAALERQYDELLAEARGHYLPNARDSL